MVSTFERAVFSPWTKTTASVEKCECDCACHGEKGRWQREVTGGVAEVTTHNTGH